LKEVELKPLLSYWLSSEAKSEPFRLASLLSGSGAGKAGWVPKCSLPDLSFSVSSWRMRSREPARRESPEAVVSFLAETAVCSVGFEEYLRVWLKPWAETTFGRGMPP